MLQMTQLAYAAHAELQHLQHFPPPWHSMAELEHVTDNWMKQWLSTRRSIAEDRSRLAVMFDTMDKIIRTDLPEYTDNPGVSSLRKLRVVRAIHVMNRVLITYRRYLRILAPLIEKVAAARNRPARLLELASGSGEMAMHLALMAKRQSLPVEVTGSDYIEDVVRDAERRAAQRELDIRFLTLNAFDMGEALDKGQYDIFLITGTMHHFKPGQLAVMMAQTRRFSHPGSFFIGFDIFRIFPMLFILPALHIMTALFCFPAFHLITSLPDSIHDAWLSVRKAYTLYELEHIAQIAVPDASITASHSFPGLSVLTARF